MRTRVEKIDEGLLHEFYATPADRYFEKQLHLKES